MLRRIAIICNPFSGKGAPLKTLPLYKKFLEERGLLYECFIHETPESLNAFSDLVIMGGDGTLNYVINRYREINIPIGYIACGTGNDIGKLLFNTSNLSQQFELSITATPQKTDAGICNGKLFLNGAGIGFDGWVVKKLLAKSLFTGKAAYYSTVISLLLFYKESPVKIWIDGKPFTRDLFMLNAANGRSYGGGFLVAPNASINDGLLDLIIISKISLFQRLRYLPVIEKGKHLEKNLSFVKYYQTKKIRIEANQTLQAHLDGEYLTDTCFEIEVLPGKYRIRF